MLTIVMPMPFALTLQTASPADANKASLEMGSHAEVNEISMKLCHNSRLLVCAQILMSAQLEETTVTQMLPVLTPPEVSPVNARGGIKAMESLVLVRISWIME